MKSVDKLRNWADGLRGIWIDPNDHSIIVTTCDDMPPSMDCVSLREHANGILDEIDREFEDMVRSLTIDAIPATDENMADTGWVRLPVDADGVPIHVGDVMEERSGHTFEAASLMAFGGSDNWLVLSDPQNFSSFREPHDIRHHHAPTVEDVLREFAYGLGVPVADSYVAAAAAKLTLRGDE